MTNTSLAFDYTNEETGESLHLPITYFKKPTNAAEYTELEKFLDVLIDQVKDDENHSLADVMQIIGDNLEQYDNEHHSPIGHGLSEVDKVKYLMSTHHMQQKDLADIFGGQANVSKFLNGERALSKKHIIQLGILFKISPAFFLE